ncbi:hypothetical protein ACS0TY_011023 [Phlomoides rotata]
MDDEFGKGTSLSTENEQNNETSHMENEIYDLTTIVEDLDAMVEAENNEECTEINNEGTSLSTENEQNNKTSHMENEIYDLTTMVEDLDAMVEAAINEECTEINNKGKNIENDDVRGSLIGITRETIEMMFELYCQHAHKIGFSVFPETRHRLCLWHLHQNAITRFGKLKSDSEFKSMFNKCLSGCGNEEEFENCWTSMITKYELENNGWFNILYGLKQKWCTALSKGFFSARIRSSQRSESTNLAIGFNASLTTNLTEFYGIYKNTVKRWRRIEQQDEFNCSRALPDTGFEMARIMRHASEVYTLTLFKEFQKEFMKGIYASSKIVGDHDTTTIYMVTSPRGESNNEVIFDSSLKLLTCDCLGFEEFGMLCYHSLRVLLINSVQKIQDAYIKNRWTKTAKSEVWDKFGRVLSITSQAGKSIPWRHNITRKFYNLVLRSEDNEDAIKIIEESLQRDSLAIDSLCYTESVRMLSSGKSSSNILDPVRSRTKKRGNRAKGHFEVSKKKRGGTSTSVQANEFDLVYTDSNLKAKY